MVGRAAAKAPLAGVPDLRMLEEELRRGRARSEQLVRSIPGIVFESYRTEDGAQGFTYISPVVEAVFGVSAEAVVGDSQHLVRLIVPAYREELEAMVEASARALTLWDYTYPFRDPRDGAVRWIHGRATPRREEDGTVRWVGVLLDVTAAKRAEFALLEQLGELRRWHDTTLGREARVAELKAEVDGLRAELGRPGRYPAVAVDGAEAADLVAGGAETARVRGALLSLIEDQRRIAAELRASRELLDATGRIAQIGGWRFELEPRVMHWTTEVFALHEIPPGEPLPLEEAMAFYHPEDRARVRDALLAGRSRGQAWDLEARFNTSTGRARWVRFVGRPVRTAAGAVVALEGTVQDITLLRSYRDRLEQLVASVDGIVWEADAETWRFTFVSEQAVRILGHPLTRWREEAGFWETILHPDDRAQAVAFCRREVAAGRDHRFEYRLLAADGRAVWLQDFVTVGTGVEGGTVLRGLMVDISARKAVEAALRASEARWRFALDGAGDGLWDWNLETDEIFFSRRWKSMLGYAAGEVAHRRAEWARLIHPADLARVEAALATHFRQHGGPGAIELRMRCRDGSWKWVLARGGVVEWRADGRPLRMIGTHTDIDETKRQREAEARLTRRLHLALAASQMGVWRYHLHTREHEWDERMQTIFGLGPEELPADEPAFLQLVHPDDRERMAAELARVRLGPGHFEYRFRIRRPDGAVRHLRSFGSVHPDEEGRPEWVTGVNEDETERIEAEERRRRLEAQLLQSQKLETLGTLAGGVAHDFNNVLAGLMGLVHHALLVLPPDHAATVHLNHASDGVLRARELVRRLLLSARRNPDAERRPVGLGPLIQDTLPLLVATLPAAVLVETRLEAPDLVVQADGGQLQQVLVNLYVNAMQAIGDRPGRIRVELSEVELGAEAGLAVPAGRYARLAVSDNGRGMDEATRVRVFEPFFTTKTPGEGTGLGLAIVQGVVHTHGGDLRVMSAPGAGATFEVFLPLGGEAGPEPGLEPKVRGRGRVVLVVDDEARLRSYLRAVLEEVGFAVETCADGRTAAARFEGLADGLALVVLDLTLPGVTGAELIVTLRARRPDLPIVLISGNHERYGALPVGGDARLQRLTKPFTPEEVVAAVAQVLGEQA